MQFHVPQFIDVEDKIFGPLTFKQFVYVIGGAGLAAIIYVFVPYKFLAWPLMVLAFGFSLALAFYKVNDKPFIYIVQAAINYITSSRLYIWQRREHEEKSKKQVKKEAEQIQRVISRMSSGQLSENGLKNKAFSVDVGEGDQKSPAPEPAHSSPNRSPS